jgi:anti-anti-sigma factor
MQILPSTEPGVVVVRLDQTLASEAGAMFRGLVREALTRSPKQLHIDCTLVTYIDSTGLGLLSLARTEASRQGCQVRLVNVPAGHPRKVLELVHFDKLFGIEAAQ